MMANFVGLVPHYKPTTRRQWFITTPSYFVYPCQMNYVLKMIQQLI